MAFDPNQITTLLAVVIGGMLGYFANYLANRQQRMWQLDSEYRAWQREELANDFGYVKKLCRKFREYAHLYVEYQSGKMGQLGQDLLQAKEDDLKSFLKLELTGFPSSLRVSSYEDMLSNLADLTDKVLRIGFDQTETDVKGMDDCYRGLKKLESDFDEKYREAVVNTFR